jgi:hypothetical protein
LRAKHIRLVFACRGTNGLALTGPPKRKQVRQ